MEICQREGIREPLLCGELMVFENRAAKRGRKIPISIVVVPAKSPSNSRTAWIEHIGGPRFSMIANAVEFAEGGSLEWFRETRDVVLIDPRGLHESHPLFCKALALPRILERYYPADRVAACREEIDRIADARHYTTLNAIDDFEDIRRWLGYEQWDVGGWSFGGRFMLTYLHRHPESIRSIFLSFPADLQFLRPLHYARFGQMGFDHLAGYCARDAECQAAFPSPATDLASVLDRLRRAPLQVKFVDPDTGLPVTRTLTHEILADELWSWLLENGRARQIPYVLRRAAEGDFAPFLEIAVPDAPQSAEPEGHYFAVVCAEETLHIPRDQIAALTRETFPGDYMVKEYLEACEAWGEPPHPEMPLQPRPTDVPLLVFTGDIDPVAQPEVGEQIVRGFSDARHISLPGIAHGLDGVENSGCYDRILTQFLEQASTRHLDTSCLGSMKPPPFRLR
ncbi:alpha/beta fold hydrolase [Pseudomarimonas salicorniae]|uniref:Alpha/beta hydrolase n=1 Tax=Pseudomarimonas salicorniae TaxID=2933270 RepID=A0ABT0GEF3_9GAMM|nr:alpha/beta hydrolase [Lysobacter sp. CAU 1642]MCK7592930.1 alpha/beta hydrolase [Lysobacter sp. CAU 1642]